MKATVAWVLALVTVLLAGCTPAELEQPRSGDGWRLLGWVRGGEVAAPALGKEADAEIRAMGLARIGGTTDPIDPATEVALLVTHAVSSSCPQVRFDGLSIDRDDRIVEARITDVSDLLFVGGCTADANPVVYWVAVQRSVLPEGPFTLRTNKAPDVSVEVSP
jgi:hypothetical protein